MENAALKICEGTINTPIGTIRYTSGPKGVIEIVILANDKHQGLQPLSNPGQDAVFSELSEYFHGEREVFTLEVVLDDLSGFSRRVIAELMKVGYGEVITYGELAARAGSPKAARAVGQIMAKNKVPIVIPCHRVVGSNGMMTGYSGGAGISTKEWLLAHERQGRDGHHYHSYQC